MHTHRARNACSLKYAACSSLESGSIAWPSVMLGSSRFDSSAVASCHLTMSGTNVGLADNVRWQLPAACMTNVAAAHLSESWAMMDECMQPCWLSMLVCD